MNNYTSWNNYRQRLWDQLYNDIKIVHIPFWNKPIKDDQETHCKMIACRFKYAILNATTITPVKSFTIDKDFIDPLLTI